MKEWEYKQLFATATEIGWVVEWIDGKAEPMEWVLDQLGFEGWEAVGIAPGDDKPGLHYLFKRPRGG